MASTIVFVLLLVLRASVSLPISRDVETVQSTKSLSESDVTERTPVLDIETVISLDEKIKPVPSLSTETVLEAFTVTFEADHVKRIKRQIMNTGETPCPSERIAYKKLCLTPEQYYDIADDDYKAES